MNAKNDFTGFVLLVLCFASILAIIYNFTNSAPIIEHELKHVEKLNSAIASESRQLQTELASHNKRLASITNRIDSSKERVHRASEKLTESTTDVNRAIEIIEDCESIIESIKAQR